MLKVRVLTRMKNFLETLRFLSLNFSYACPETNSNKRMSATMECNPQTFYINKTSKSEIFGTMQNIQSLVSSSTLIFHFTFLPFLIITPFWVEKLRTANRKIIAMISLSDCLNLILALIMGARRSDYSDAAWGYLLFECTFITMLQNIAPTWSILW